jgi:hypothetical protein
VGAYLESPSGLFIFISLAPALAVQSRNCISLYLSRESSVRSAGENTPRSARASKNPEVLLVEATRIAWLRNWPKLESCSAGMHGLEDQSGFSEAIMDGGARCCPVAEGGAAGGTGK